MYIIHDVTMHLADIIKYELGRQWQGNIYFNFMEMNGFVALGTVGLYFLYTIEHILEKFEISEPFL